MKFDLQTQRITSCEIFESLPHHSQSSSFNVITWWLHISIANFESKAHWVAFETFRQPSKYGTCDTADSEVRVTRSAGFHITLVTLEAAR